MTQPVLCELIIICLKIWSFAAFSPFLQEIAKKFIDPTQFKGRRENTALTHSRQFGTFRSEDPVPPHFHQFYQEESRYAPQGVLRGADYSRPFFSSTKSPYSLPIYSQGEFHQGGPSGLILALLGRFFESDFALPPLCSELTPQEFQEFLKVMMCALVYSVGGHNFLELLHSVTLPPTIAVMNSVSPAHCEAITGQNILKCFSTHSLTTALKTAHEYEVWRRAQN